MPGKPDDYNCYEKALPPLPPDMLRALVEKSRSVRRFREEVPVRCETLESLVALARLSPSGGNKQPLKFLPQPIRTEIRLFVLCSVVPIRGTHDESLQGIEIQFCISRLNPILSASRLPTRFPVVAVYIRLPESGE